jgi:hypothetical protein
MCVRDVKNERKKEEARKKLPYKLKIGRSGG